VTIQTIALKNLASFVDFRNDSPFRKNNLIFGKNGSGKSTLVNLLQFLQDCYDDPTKADGLKTFIRHRLSKEAPSGQVELSFATASKSASIKYDPQTDTIDLPPSLPFQLCVFNDEYTNRNIGNVIDVRLPDNGLVIGEVNKELELARSERKSAEAELNNRIETLRTAVASAIAEYKATTHSGSNVDAIINVESLLTETCPYSEDDQLLTQRTALGFEKAERVVLPFNEGQFSLGIDADSAETRCQETVHPPAVLDELAPLLRDYSTFFETGLDIFDNQGDSRCPFCRRDWPDSAKVVSDYRSFLTSTYNSKRRALSVLKEDLEAYKRKVESQREAMRRGRITAESEGTKYGIDTSTWQDLTYGQGLHDQVVTIIDKKHAEMATSYSVRGVLAQLEQHHLSVVRANNDIIRAIDKAIDNITQQRKQINSKIAYHYLKRTWREQEPLRSHISQLKRNIAGSDAKIALLEQSDQAQDTVQYVFNGLLSLTGITEYTLSGDHKLHLRLTSDYDISHEGGRISTAQRKILSLCYFFADVVSRVSNVNQFRRYVLVFDDPVDSADYVYFHSIAAILERCEDILSLMLSRPDVKFGQFFVFTHNSLLYDRLSCSWKEYSKCLEKRDNQSRMEQAEKCINNYTLYLDEIIMYYKNPKPDRRRMTYIGNLIRRVLEIMASFDQLGPNNFAGILDGMGKPSLAILANHLSHDSFSRVLNPLATADELRAACGQLIDVIKERHPFQYKTLSAKYQIDEGGT
jgi:hypothetical protein